MNSLKSVLNINIVRFIISGCIGTFTQVALIYIFTDLFSIYYLVSGTLAFLGSQTVGFVLQKLWTFKNYNKADTHKQAVFFITNGIFILILNTIFLYILVDIFNFYYIVAQILASLCMATISFFSYRYIFQNRYK